MSRVSNLLSEYLKGGHALPLFVTVFLVSVGVSGCGFDRPWWPWGGFWGWGSPDQGEEEVEADAGDDAGVAPSEGGGTADTAVSSDSAGNDTAATGDANDDEDEDDNTGDWDDGNDDDDDNGDYDEDDYYDEVSTEPEVCDNDYDDDWDGRVDCQSEECIGDPACPVTPGHCDDPFVISSIGGTTEGSFEGATNNNRSDCGGRYGRDQVYQFEVAESGAVEVLMTGVEPVLYLDDGTCGDFRESIACANQWFGEMFIVYGDDEDLIWYWRDEFDEEDDDDWDEEYDTEADVFVDAGIGVDAGPGGGSGMVSTARLIGHVEPGVVYYLWVDSDYESSGHGYTLDHVLRPNPCDDSPCSGLQECTPSYDYTSYECSCPEDMLPYGDTCVDNPCLPNPCTDPAATICEPQLPDNYFCECTIGYERDAATDTCLPIPGETCAAPIPLDPGSGTLEIELSEGLDIHRGFCGGRGEPDQVFEIVVDEPGVVAFDLTGLDPSLSLQDECTSEYGEIACADKWRLLWTDENGEDDGDEYNYVDDEEESDADEGDLDVDTGWDDDMGASDEEEVIWVDAGVISTDPSGMPGDGGIDYIDEWEYMYGTARLWHYLEAGVYYLWVNIDNAPGYEGGVLNYEYRNNPCDAVTCEGVAVCEPSSDWLTTECVCPDDMLPYENGCVDNPCLTNPCVADHMNVCTPNLPGEYACSCNVGAELNADGTACVPIPGDSCEAPIIIEPGEGIIQGSTMNSNDFYRGECAGRGPENVYQFEITEPMTMEFRMTGFDTVLYIRENCMDADSEIACNDDYGFYEYEPYDDDDEWDTGEDIDSTDMPTAGFDAGVDAGGDIPPDYDSFGVESYLSVSLDPGVYYLFADGYHSSGNYELRYNFASLL